jgi:hypothetical protein
MIIPLLIVFFLFDHDMFNRFGHSKFHEPPGITIRSCIKSIWTVPAYYSILFLIAELPISGPDSYDAIVCYILIGGSMLVGALRKGSILWNITLLRRFVRNLGELYSSGTVLKNPQWMALACAFLWQANLAVVILYLREYHFTHHFNRDTDSSM